MLGREAPAPHFWPAANSAFIAALGGAMLGHEYRVRLRRSGSDHAAYHRDHLVAGIAVGVEGFLAIDEGLRPRRIGNRGLPDLASVQHLGEGTANQRMDVLEPLERRS